MRKRKFNKCPDCGKFMKLSETWSPSTDFDYFDEEMAMAEGYDIHDPDIDPYKDYSHCSYMLDVLECVCGYGIAIDEGEHYRYYFNPEHGDYDWQAPVKILENGKRESKPTVSPNQLPLL